MGGYIKAYVSNTGWVIIQGESGLEYVFHKKDVQHPEDIAVGRIVAFDDFRENGVWKAHCIIIWDMTVEEWKEISEEIDDPMYLEW